MDRRSLMEEVEVVHLHPDQRTEVHPATPTPAQSILATMVPDNRTKDHHYRETMPPPPPTTTIINHLLQLQQHFTMVKDAIHQPTPLQVPPPNLPLPHLDHENPPSTDHPIH